MTDYTKLVESLRHCAIDRNCQACEYDTTRHCVDHLKTDAADAIEELQDKVVELEEWLNDDDVAADDNARQIEELAKRNAELHAELERWVSAAEKAGEPKRGEWVRKEDELTYWYVCSKCGYRPHIENHPYLSDFCPNCGAKMMEVRE